MEDNKTDGSSALAANDPYRNMEDRDIAPEYAKNRDSKNARDDDKIVDFNEAKNRLRGNESAASKDIENGNGNLPDTKEKENNQGDIINFSGSGKGKKHTKKPKLGVGGFLKKHGPLGLILLVLLGGGAIFGGSQALLPFAIADRMMEEFNSMHTVMSRRGNVFFRFQMGDRKYRNPTSNTIFGEKFKLSTKQKNKLKLEGIEYAEVDVGGKKRSVLLFDDGSGTKQPVLTNSDMDKAGDIMSSLKSQNPDLELKPSAINVDDAFEINDFRNGYMKSSKTWRGHFSGWFDSGAINVMERLGISRNRYAKWQKNHEDIEAGNKAFKEAAANKNKATDGETVGKEKVTEEELDPDTGEKRTTTSYEDTEIKGTSNADGHIPGVDTDSDSVMGKSSKTEIEAGLKAKISKVAQGAGSIACAASMASGAIYATIAAYQISEALNIISGFLESVDKTKSGGGTNSPMDYYLNALTKSDPDQGTAMSAMGMAMLFGSTTVNKNNASVLNYNPESLLQKVKSSSLLGNFVNPYTEEDFSNCSYARMGVALVSLVSSFIPGGKAVTTLLKVVGSVLGSAAIGLLIQGFMTFLIPKAADMLMRDIVTDMVGEDLGNALIVGATKTYGTNHQNGGGSLGDEAAITAFRQEMNAVIAEDARHDRETLSPFDTSSQHTFLGSILFAAIPLTTNFSHVSTVFTNFSNLVHSSIGKILPAAGALADTRLITSTGDCALLESIGAKGDIYCQPYMISDTSTIEEDPGEIFEKVAGLDSNNFLKESNGEIKLDEDDNPVVNIKSDFGKFAVACTQRNGNWGLADTDMAARIGRFDIDTGNGYADSAISGALGATPVGDIQEILEVIEGETNKPYISGRGCVTSAENENWANYKYYQRYIEDQRLMENSGMIKKSAVTAALEEYYTENPLDDSPEGIIASFSGMNKEQFLATIDLVDYLDFLAKYDPSGLNPLPVKETKISFISLIKEVILPSPINTTPPSSINFHKTINIGITA